MNTGAAERHGELRFLPGTERDTEEIVRLHCATADELTKKFGRGPWSLQTTEQGVLFALRNSHLYVARDEQSIVGVLQLVWKKPWAIDPSYFTPAAQPIHLIGMAVATERQRSGIGRWMLQQACTAARALGADAVRLDAYDAAAGAGGFYTKCGCEERGRVVYRNAPLVYFECLLNTSDH